MARPKKDGKPVSFVLQRQIVEELDKYYAETGIPKTTIVEKALKAYLYKKESTSK